MAKRPNYLLGYGERLSEPVEIKGGGGKKIAPYQFDQARDRVSRMLRTTVEDLDRLPEMACPDGQAVAAFTLNPEYLAKSYYPGGLLREAGLRMVGSRSRVITPEQRSRGRTPEPMVTNQLFVAGARSSFARLSNSVPSWDSEKSSAKHLPAIEQVSLLTPTEKVKPIAQDEDEKVPLEIVLHASPGRRDKFILRGFKEYSEAQGLEPDMERLFFAGRLCFLRMYAQRSQLENIATYSFLRVLREMPKLRTTRPILRGESHRPRPMTLPEGEPVDPNIRVAVFDGGLSESSPLQPWAEAHEVPGIGEPHPDLIWHGETVTSAILFGPMDGDVADRPVCKVDHYRVLDTQSEKDPFELYEVLERIDAVLARQPYEFVSLSIGPTLPIDDEEVHAWTAVLDDRLAEGRCLTTIAAGNTGDDPDDPVVRPRRVQVPSDCVNGLTVGASDRREGEWNRARYSSRGPGRSPGIVKPDLVMFGGSDHEPFWVCDPDTPGRVVATAGTSYSAPTALRLGAAVRAHFGAVLSPLAIKALLVHATESGGHVRDEVGWGRVEGGAQELTICPDGSARIVYQDEISVGKYRRIQIPIPKDGLEGNVNISATFCFATEVDPEHPGSYTRSGLTIVFRPDLTKFDKEDAVHPKTAEFFQPAKLYPIEQELRKDAHKWETCLHMTKTKRATSLDQPVFDIHYNARSEGHDDMASRNIRYALVITVEAPKVKDLYDRVVRTYRAKLQPLNPVIEVPVRT